MHFFFFIRYRSIGARQDASGPHGFQRKEAVTPGARPRSPIPITSLSAWERQRGGRRIGACRDWREGRKGGRARSCLDYNMKRTFGSRRHKWGEWWLMKGAMEQSYYCPMCFFIDPLYLIVFLSLFELCEYKVTFRSKHSSPPSPSLPRREYL